MRNRTCQAVLILSLFTLACLAQSISPHWEELTAPDFVKALDQAKGVCLLPFGIIEKHGPSGPMGTDLINVRYATFEATKQEYAIVFPEYYFGQIFEAKHQPGTIAYSTRLQLELLQENHRRDGAQRMQEGRHHQRPSGNTNLIAFFAQTTLETPKDYVVYAITNAPGQAAQMPAAARPSKSGVDGHAGEVEIASVMASRPDLAHPERAGTESGADLKRLDLPANVYTGIWWYARFPNHYQGDASGATAARGAALQQIRADAIASAIRAIKADQVSPRLQKEFFDEATHPIDMKQ